MTSEIEAAGLLGHASTIGELMPVNDAAAAAVGRRLRSMASTLRIAEAELQALDQIPSWSGDAGRSFERMATRLPGDAERATRVFATAGHSFIRLAEDIASARPDVIAAFELWRLAEQQSRRWHADLTDAEPMGAVPNSLDPVDPGRATADRAIRLYADAHDRMEDSTTVAMRTLLIAASTAPGIEDLLHREGALESLAGTGRGVADFGSGVAQFAWDFNQFRAVFDRDGYSADVGDVLTGVDHLVHHPGDIDDVLLNLELLRDDPIRWVGAMLVPLILFPPLPGTTSVAGGTTGRIASRLGRPTAFVARRVDDLTSLATQFRLPAPQALDMIANPASVRQVLDSARRIDADDDDLERVAEDHGGEARDYERKVATLKFDGEPDLTFEFVHNTETDDVHDPRIVTGGFPGGCPD